MSTFAITGIVKRLLGLVIESHGPRGAVGDLCRIQLRSGESVPAEIIGFTGEMTQLFPLTRLQGIAAGDLVYHVSQGQWAQVGRSMLGRVLNGFLEPIDGRGELFTRHRTPLKNQPPGPLERRRITEVLPTGIRALDALLTVGKGQRIGIFSGSGIGKSVLLGMLSRYAQADVNVIALIGERGREVREFIEKDLGPEGLARSVVVAVTSDQPALAKIRGAWAATAVAEYFRDQGKDVLLMMDSVTRFAMAQREVGLAVGEPPTTKGYTPSVFALLPGLLERSGTSPRGTITGFYNVLVDGDDMLEPVADAVRSILDGHVVLSRKLAAANHYPAIDPLDSISRVMVDIVDPEQMAAARQVLSHLATYREAEDLIHIGAYVKGSSAAIDQAVDRIPAIRAFLRQDLQEFSDWRQTVDRLQQLVS
ncbi:MAG: FliI/YscN family ATPase [Candidatus Delongbacteria bacterium]|nr:FliI/YscN family ATPase [Candidatus Delongbacteria bacterium]